MWAKFFSGSWKTGVVGGLTLICGATEIIGMLPEKYSMGLMKVCLTLVGLGLIAAKDSNVSHAPAPVQPTATISAADLPPAPVPPKPA